MEQIKPLGGGTGNSDQKTHYIGLKKEATGFEFRGKFRVTHSKKNEEGKTSLTHYFDDAEGKPVGINGTAQLDDCISQIQPGTWVLIRKVGERKVKNNPRRTTQLVDVFRISEEEAKAGAPAEAPKKAAGGLPF